ncbi:MAG: fimbrillin family protein [Paramuribaculum sp.]|nr:fimbrillin family protein [Paramuribaculum sp.]
MKKIYILAAAALTMASCDNSNDNTDNSPQPAKIYATIGESPLSRASESKWAPNDKIGISSSVGAVGGPYVNVEYTTAAGDGNFTGTDLFFYKPMTLIAYYPFDGVEGSVPGVDGLISANTGPDNQTSDLQPGYDFLWDSQSGFTASDPKVNFTFSHKMSKITFTFISSESAYNNGVEISKGVDVSTMVAYDLEELVVDGTFNTATGVCSVDDDTPKDNRGLKIEFPKNTVVDKEPMPSLIVFPQTLKGGSVTLRIYTDELDPGAPLQEYKCSLAFSSGEIKSGCHYTYSIQVTKHGLMVGQVSIKGWEEEPDRFMTATIDGDPNFKE